MILPGSSGPVPDPLARRVRSTPDRTAVIDAASGETWRYDELDAVVVDIAGRLAGLGLESGDHLGLLSRTSVDAVCAIHAAWRLGLPIVPLSVRLTETELEHQVSRCDLDAIACDGEVAATAGQVFDGPVVTIDDVGASPSNDTPAADGEGRPLSAVEPADWTSATWEGDDPALLLFTSGTTGDPKGVDLTMGNLLASATASAFRLGVLPSDRWLLCLPVYHMGGLAPIVRSAVYGTTLVVKEGFDPEAVARTARDYDVTGLSLVPTQLARILDVAPDFGPSIRTVLLGGAPTPPPLLDHCRELGVPIYPTYGLTETASQVATATPEQAFAHEGTVGQPLFGTEVTIVDEERRPIRVGETGEIVVSGPTVTPGYHDDPDATEAAFCRHGLLTGDIGHRDEEGRLWVTGRRADRIVTGGENVDPNEVANVLRDHEHIEDAAVIGLPDPEWGERVAAMVVTGADGTPDAEALVEFCRGRLAGYKCPRTVAFADELPRTASGTVDRAAARAQFVDEAGDPLVE